MLSDGAAIRQTTDTIHAPIPKNNTINPGMANSANSRTKPTRNQINSGSRNF